MNWLLPVKHISAALICTTCTLSLSAEEAQSSVFNGDDKVLTINRLVEQVLNNNAQVIYTDIQRRIAKEKITFEEGIYETEFFSNVSYDDAHTQRSAAEKASYSISAINKNILDETNSDLTIGVRRLIPTGGEISLSYLTGETNNNIIPSSTDTSERDSEFTTAVTLELTQPLLKGRGNVATSTRIKRAKIEDKIVDAQYRQQILKVIFDVSSSYWQLYKITQFISVREAALANANNTLNDIKLKTQRGKESQSSVFDAESEVLKRKIALDGARQARNEVIYKISTLINLNPNDLAFELNSTPDTSKFELALPFEEYYNLVLATWPNYQVLSFNIALQDQEIKLVNDELKPRLDLTLGYTVSDLSDDFNGSDAFSNDYHSWNVGLNFSMPIGGNDRIHSKKSIASLKRTQQVEDLKAVKIGLKNDLQAKLFQVRSTYQELVSLTENVSLLEELFNAEKKKFDLGYGELVDVYSREDSLNLERQRLIDGQVKYEIAKLSLALADGSLFSEYTDLN